MIDGDPVKRMAGALGRIPSGLFIVTFCRGSAETGMLASWVQQCSFNPPQISMAVQRGRPVLGWLEPEAPFTVNVLDTGETDYLIHFGKGFALGEPAFEGIDIDRHPGSAPVLREALAYLDCRVVDRISGGDHELFIGRVVGGNVLGDGQPMVHIRKNGLHY